MIPCSRNPHFGKWSLDAQFGIHLGRPFCVTFGCSGGGGGENERAWRDHLQWSLDARS